MNPQGQNITPEAFKQRIIQKYPNGVASDGRRYADIDATELTQKIVTKYPNAVTNDGIPYKSFLGGQTSAASGPTGVERAGRILGGIFGGDKIGEAIGANAVRNQARSGRLPGVVEADYSKLSPQAIARLQAKGVPISAAAQRDETADTVKGPGARAVIGDVIGVASNFVGAPGVGKVASLGAKGLARQAVKQGAKTGLITGAMQGFGGGLKQEDATVGSVIGSTVGGAASGTALGAGTGYVANKIGGLLPKNRARIKFEKATSDLEKIQNPGGKVGAKQSENLLGGGKTETRGKGVFKRDVPARSEIIKNDHALQMTQEGKLKASNTPGENIAAINEESAKINVAKNEILDKPGFNRPFTQTTIDSKIDDIISNTKKSRKFLSASSEERAYEDAAEIFREEIAKHPMNNKGLQDATASFNKRMEELGDIYSQSGEATTIGKARIQAAKDFRKLAYDHIAGSIDKAQTVDALKIFKPKEAQPLIDKASKFPRKEDFIRSQEKTFKERVLNDTSYRAEKRRIQRSMDKDGLTFDQALAREDILIDAQEDLGDIWDIAHTEANPQAGKLYNQYLRNQAQILNLKDDIAFNGRTLLNQSNAKRFLNKPLVKRGIGLAKLGVAAGIGAELTD